MFPSSYFASSYFGGYFQSLTTEEFSFGFTGDRGTRIEEILFVGSNVFINTTSMWFGKNVHINSSGFSGKILNPTYSNLIIIGDNSIIITPGGITIGPLTINSSGVFINGAPI